jgi:hypothetical protein
MGRRAFPKLFPEESILHSLQTRDEKKLSVSSEFLSGAYRDRTGDLRLAKPTLSQLS